MSKKRKSAYGPEAPTHRHAMRAAAQHHAALEAHRKKFLRHAQTGKMPSEGDGDADDFTYQRTSY